jgi:cutinase
VRRRTIFVIGGVALATTLALPLQSASATFGSFGSSSRSGALPDRSSRLTAFCEYVERRNADSEGASRLSAARAERIKRLCNANSGGTTPPTTRPPTTTPPTTVPSVPDDDDDEGSGGGVSNPAGCADVDVSFARGTGEPQGLGVLGTPLAAAIKRALSGETVNVRAVQYAAAFDQSSAGPGGTDLARHVNSVAARCPATKFVLGGYSQGASVVDNAIGIRSGLGSPSTAINASASRQVAAIVTFGNPLMLSGRTIASAAPGFADRTKEFCATGDPVCGGGGNFAAHLAYSSNGDVQRAADFITAELR